MRVFVTGATGFVGSAVVGELLSAGHQVLGLTRSAAGAERLTAAGATPHHGSLEDLDSLRRGAEACDAVIHTAFNHDFSRFLQSCQEDRQIVATVGEALRGSQRPLLVTSGLGLLSGDNVDEDTPVHSGPDSHPRAASDVLTHQLAEQGINASIVRLPPSVHGEGDHGFVPILIGIARTRQLAAWVEDGSNTWPAVHRRDAARLYRLAVENARPGHNWHAVHDTGIAMREIVSMIGQQLKLPVQSLAANEAEAYFTWFHRFALMNVKTGGEKTRALLGWQPQEIGLLEDLALGHYFAQ